MMMAGLLTYSTISAFPSRLRRDSGGVETILFDEELTATGIVRDFHLVPFLMQYPEALATIMDCKEIT